MLKSSHRIHRHLLWVCTLATSVSGLTILADEPKMAKLADRLKKIQATAKAPSGAATGVKPVSNPQYDRMLKSVALILCEAEDGSTCNGTGWVVDAEQRLLVTNHHVIEGFTDCKVFFPEYVDGQLITDPSKSITGSRAIGGIVKDSDPECDLAIVQIEKLPSGIVPLELADSSATPGQTIHSIAGSTVGSQSLWIYSTGHVRQIVRGMLATGHEASVLESDMATNQGNSGGPVCDDEGRVVAVVEGARTDARLMSLKVELQSLADYLTNGLRCIEPRSVEDLKFSAERHLAADRPEVALKLITQALKKEKKSADLFAMRGKCWLRQGDLDTARGDFADALEIDGSCSEAHCGQGVIAFKEEEYEESIEHYSNALRHDPGNIDYILLRAEARDYFGEYETALSDYNAVLKKDPNSTAAVRGRSIVQIELGNFDQGMQGMNAIAEYYREDPAVFFYSGYAMNALNDFANAVVVLRHTIALDPEYTGAHLQLGNALVELGQLEEAVEVLNQAIELDSEDAEAHLLLGTAAWKLGDQQTGQALIKEAIQLASEDDELKQTARETLAELRNQ